MPRINKKCIKIFYDLLGKPANQAKRTEKQKKLDQVILTQYIDRSR